MKNTLFFLVAALLLGCSSKDKNKIYVNAQLANFQSWMGSQVDVYSPNSLDPDPDTTMHLYVSGKLKDTLQLKGTGYYIINFGPNTFEAYLEKGKEFKFTSDYVNFYDNLKFEGDNADMNTFLFNYQREISKAPENIQLGSFDEKMMMAAIEKMENDIKVFIDANAKNIPDSLVERARLDAKYALSLWYFKYAERHNVSEMFINFQRRYDFNNPKYLKLSFSYGAAALKHYLSLLNLEKRPISIETLDVFLKEKNTDQQLREYVLAKYAIDRFSQNDPDKANTYNYLLNHIADNSYKKAAYKVLIRSNRKQY